MTYWVLFARLRGSRVQTPFSVQRRIRMEMVCQGPNSFGSRYSGQTTLSPFATVFINRQNSVKENNVFNFDVTPLNGKHVLDLVVLSLRDVYHPRSIRNYELQRKTIVSTRSNLTTNIRLNSDTSFYFLGFHFAPVNTICFDITN